MKRGIRAGSHLQSEGRVELTILSSPAACDHSLVLVFLKTNVPNGNCLSPRLSKNLSQALRTDKICPLRRSSNFSTSRLESESWDPTGLSSANPTPKTWLLFIVGFSILLSSGFVDCRPNPEVQQTSDYRSKVRFPYTSDRSPEVFDSRPRKRTRRVSKSYR
jgi:hypothetical protein